MRFTLPRNSQAAAAHLNLHILFLKARHLESRSHGVSGLVFTEIHSVLKKHSSQKLTLRPERGIYPDLPWLPDGGFRILHDL